MKQGDKVVIVYASGNRDERRFANPRAFDLSRSPNQQMSFGAGGVHYCRWRWSEIRSTSTRQHP